MKNSYTKIQTTILVLLRLIIGYHFLFEGLNKLLNPGWTSSLLLLQTDWLLSDIFHYLADSQILLGLVDFLNIWGQILIGFSLLIGLFTTYAAISGSVLMLLYYISIPPFANGAVFVDKNLLELFAFIIIFSFPTSNIYGLDYLINKFKSKKNG